ncbi:N-acetylmuramoyl-L-alanine amidase [Lysinibacillus irui]|uniref:N-acetylmuramoyl-L-alanine amidase n=1 Tax=Lysinibacillus irui TaxID=2998077 RepID=UPI004043D4CE
MTKKFVGSSGHGLKIRGAKHFIDEVDEARKVTNEVHRILTTEYNGAGTVFHDNSSTTQNQNLQTIVTYHNGQQRNLDWSIHFNAASFIDGPRGVEVLYYDAKDLSARVSAAISKTSGLKNRGAKQRKELYFLKNTTKPAILLEICFVDSKADVNLYHKNFNGICATIAEVLANYLGYTKKQTDIQKEEHSVAKELLNETGRDSCKEMIQRGISEGLFSSKHENVDKYTDKDLISYGMAYLNRKTK